MHVLQVTESLAVDFGGTAAACAQLVTHLHRSQVDVSVLMSGSNGSKPGWTLDPGIPARHCTTLLSPRVGLCPDFRRVAATLPRPDLIHVHGLWRLHYWQAARYARALAVPVVVSVHGMLDETALKQRAGLKRAARRIYQDGWLAAADCLHATADAEAVEIRRCGFRNPVAVIPWGADATEKVDANGLTPRRSVLYLGRLHPQKSLHTLLEAWSRINERRAGWRLVIAGPDSDRYRSVLMDLATQLGVVDSVTWPGAAMGADRERLFADAGIVVLPSAHENFGLIVAEALARGVPAIATHGAPWVALADEQCGWWIPTGPDALAAAFADALTRSSDELRAMGERGRRFVMSRFRWEGTAAAMRELYEWIAGTGPQPAFVDA